MRVMLQKPDVQLDCATEAIQLPGAIQPHGYLLTLTQDACVAQVSANFALFSGKSNDVVLQAPLSQAIGTVLAERVERALASLAEGETTLLGTTPSLTSDQADARRWAVILHRFAGIAVLEFDLSHGLDDVYGAMYPIVRAFAVGIQDTHSIEDIAQFAATEIARIAGFGRTLVYAFDKDSGHGQVLAEALQPGYDSYLGQRFPASDIPAQARELYKRNRIRLIADANYSPQALVPALHPDTQAPTDLTLASLRSVSPVHIQYMKNMHTQASMSMSIVVDDRLWGLISCHHHEAFVPAYELRVVCEHIAQLISMQLAAREAQDDARSRLNARLALSNLTARMTAAPHFVDALVEHADEFLSIATATGAAIVFDGRITCVGRTPDEADVEKLVDWLVKQDQEVVYTDQARDIGTGIDDEAVAGFCAVSLSRVFRNYVIWFRAEVIQTIKWAGDPKEKLSALSGKVSPRESFAVWTETVRHRCMPWAVQEIDVAVEFRTALLLIVLSRAEEISSLALELSHANRELEEFSYTVSHDLRAPLRHIHSFAALLREMEEHRLSDRGKDFVARIVSASETGGDLVDALLSFAQMGRAAFDIRRVDLSAVIREMIAGEKIGEGHAVNWVVGPLPVVQADLTFLRDALQNLLSNAIKFSRNEAQPTIEIKSVPGTGEMSGYDVLSVKDNGVGFDMRYVDKLFKVFQRLHREDEYSGSGIGLANVRRIVERHGGKVWADSVPGQGATFFVAMPVEPRSKIGKETRSAASIMARMAATGVLVPTGGVRKAQLENS